MLFFASVADIQVRFRVEFFMEAINMKVRKKAKIRNQYNQVPHLTQNTLWESDKHTQENITYKKANRSVLSQQVTTRLQ